jgi:hypothetical protein
MINRSDIPEATAADAIAASAAPAASFNHGCGDLRRPISIGSTGHLFIQINETQQSTPVVEAVAIAYIVSIARHSVVILVNMAIRLPLAQK